MTNWKKAITLVVLMFSLVPVVSQERSDTVFVFRFVPDQDMFFATYRGNGQELDRLYECVERNKAAILDGSIPVYVNGYCSSLGSEQENLAMAKVRSNRVKSELILHKGLTENCFVTRNHADEGNFVTVCIVVPALSKEALQAAEARRVAEQERLVAERQAAEARRVAEQERLVAERQAEEARLAAEQAKAGQLARPASDRQPGHLSSSSRFALRANLLRWATLTPDFGIEWRIDPSWGVLVNGSWTSWSWDSKHRRFALWEVAPELRYYLGAEKRGYLGALYKVGGFNYKLSATGLQGDLMGGGIAGGYVLQLNDAFSLDFSLAVGCLHADYEKYEVIDGVRVRCGSETKNWWGPVDAGVTLVWRLW